MLLGQFPAYAFRTKQRQASPEADHQQQTCHPCTSRRRPKTQAGSEGAAAASTAPARQGAQSHTKNGRRLAKSCGTNCLHQRSNFFELQAPAEAHAGDQLANSPKCKKVEVHAGQAEQRGSASREILPADCGLACTALHGSAEAKVPKEVLPKSEPVPLPLLLPLAWQGLARALTWTRVPLQWAMQPGWCLEAFRPCLDRRNAFLQQGAHRTSSW